MMHRVLRDVRYAHIPVLPDLALILPVRHCNLGLFLLLLLLLVSRSFFLIFYGKLAYDELHERGLSCAVFTEQSAA